MKYARLLLTLAVSLTFLQLQAQKFNHSIGIDICFPGEKIVTSSASYISGDLFESSFTRLTRVSLSYFPRYTFLPKKKLSISIGMPATLGIALSSVESSSIYLPESGATKIYGNKNAGTRFAAEIPVVADLNFRAFSTVRNIDQLVVFLGGGYAYNHAGFKVETDMYTNIYNIDVFQPYFHGGIRIMNKKPVAIAATFRPAKQYGKEQAAASWGIQLLRQL